MKKFISLVLALVMALSLTTVAWGADPVAKIGTTEYDSLAAAVTAATAGDEIVLLKDVADGVGIVIDKKLTIDFGGYTYTFASNPVGSTGTESQGFQILKAANAVTLKNGTLTSKAGSGVKMLVNNYCDLTLDGMTLIGTNLDGGGKYVLSNNAGDVVIEDTTITAAADGVAFDSYDYSAGGYTTPPTVTVKGTSVVNGKVEAAGGKLEVQSGTVNGDIDVVGDGQTSDVVVKGGTFTDDVTDYLAAGVELNNGVVVPKGGASVTAKAYKMTSNGTLVPGDVNAIYAPAVAAVLNDDGKQTNTADISHYTFEGVNCVVAASLADADFVLYSDAAGKNVMMYLKAAVTSYNGTGAVYANFGKACGQVTYTAEVGKTYYTTNANGDAGIYVADKEGTKALMVGGKLVLVKAAPVAYTTAAVKHAAVPTVKDGKVIGYTCATCKTVAVEAPNFMSIPKGAVQDGLPGNWYWPVAVVTPSTDKVTSAETFDAGIAMYVGMSVMAAAGSAVVLKKKD